MNLYDTMSQASLNDLIDDLLNNFHKEVGLDLDNPVNDYCGLSFDTSDGLDAGSEVIFNNGDELRIGFSNQRLALLGYSLRFYYYLLDKGDLDGSKAYGELQSFVVDLDSDLVSVPFTDDQVYLQKGFDLIMMGNNGSRLYLSANTTFVFDEDCVLTAEYVSGGEPVESATITFYDGETVVGTSTTDDEGIATLTLETLSGGSHSFLALVDGVYSNSVSVTVGSNNVMELSVTGSSFSTYSSSPFTYNGRVFVDWGDDTGLVEYTNGYLQHSYATNGEYDVKVYGDITNINYSGFTGCTGLTSISLPNSVQSIGNACFGGCTGLTSITLPNSITTLGIDCFRGCTGLTSISLPNSVQSIGNACFRGCTGLTSITLPNSITTLGIDCFRGCSGLTSITLPNSITSLGAGCFTSCDNLAFIKLQWTNINDIISYEFPWAAGTPENLKLHIPLGTTQIYLDKGYPSDKLIEET